MKGTAQQTAEARHVPLLNLDARLLLLHLFRLGHTTAEKGLLYPWTGLRLRCSARPCSRRWRSAEAHHRVEDFDDASDYGSLTDCPSLRIRENIFN